MRLLGIGPYLATRSVRKFRRSVNVHRGSSRVVNCILWRWSSGHHVHVATPPVFDSKVGFTDYEKERKEFRLEVPEYFNFANVIDEWAQKEKVGRKILHINERYGRRNMYT